MLANAFTKWLWDSRRSVITWSAGVAAVGGFYAALWPSIDDPKLQEATEAYPQALLEAVNFTDISTAASYLNASVYGLVVAVLVLVYAIGAGARTIAGDEVAGTLDLIAAHPLSRRRLALQRFAALAVSLGILVGALWLVILALAAPAQLDGISVARFGAMHLHLFLFGSLFGALAYAVGAGSGSRSSALGIASGVAVLAFVADGVLSQVKGLEWAENLSAFHWLNGENPLQSGVETAGVLLMLGLALVLVAIGTWLFERRDIAV